MAEQLNQQEINVEKVISGVYELKEMPNNYGSTEGMEENAIEYVVTNNAIVGFFPDGASYTERYIDKFVVSKTKFAFISEEGTSTNPTVYKIEWNNNSKKWIYTVSDVTQQDPYKGMLKLRFDKPLLFDSLFTKIFDTNVLIQNHKRDLYYADGYYDGYIQGQKSFPDAEEMLF